MIKRTRFFGYIATVSIAASLAWTLPARSADSIDAETYRQLDLFMDIFERVRVNYVDEVSDKKLIQGAIAGMVSSLDPHSSYLDEKSFKRMRTQTEGKYGGLGIEITMEDGVVKIVAPFADTPASRAGLKSGDFITKVNDEPIYGMTIEEAVSRMKGPPKTEVKITVVRRGEKEPMNLTLIRETIVLRPVRFDMHKGVAHIRITSFNKQTGDQLKKVIGTAENKKAYAYLLDLRSNPGGLLDQAIEVVSAFIKKGEIVSQRGRNKSDIQRYYANGEDLTRGKPIIVLVDEGSASASEIVAGALQDYRRAVIIGTRTFGKGSVQTLIPISRSSSLRLTTARYYTPSSRSVQEQGIDPDIYVPQLTDKYYKQRGKYREDALRNHLSNKNKAKAEELSEEKDTIANPLFEITAEELKKAKITDYQLDYALKILGKLAPTSHAGKKRSH